MNIVIQREVAYSETISIPDSVIADGTYFNVVWCWRKAARADDWHISKSVQKLNGELKLELDKFETTALPFNSGYVSIYKIDSSTGVHSHYADGTVIVNEGTAGSAVGGTQSVSAPTPWLYTYEGMAAVDKMVGRYVASANGLLSKLTLSAQVAPVGQAIQVEVYVDGVAQGITASLNPGAKDSETSINIVLTQGSVVELYITQVGDIGSGVGLNAVLDSRINI